MEVCEFKEIETFLKFIQIYSKIYPLLSPDKDIILHLNFIGSFKLKWEVQVQLLGITLSLMSSHLGSSCSQALSQFPQHEATGSTVNSLLGATSRFVHLEKFSLKFSSWMFAVRLNLHHP